MKRRYTVLVLALALAGLTAASCGGGGGNVKGGMMGGGVAATFTPSNAAPGANSITMSAGAAVGDTFKVVISVKDIVDFFGAAFRVTFNAGSAEFLSFDASTSFLQNSAPDININAAVDPNNAGVVLVNATLQGPLQGLNTSTAPELITLTFRATNPTGGNAFTFGVAGNRVVTTCPDAGISACTNVADATLAWNGGTLTAN